MKLSTLALAVAAILPAASAPANSIEVDYTATVSNALGTNTSTYGDGTTISGQFFIDATTGAVTRSTLGIYSAPNSGVYASSTNTGNTGSDAVYALGTYASAGAPSNSSISVDFSALSNYSVTDPVLFLLQFNGGSLASQVDFTGAASSFPSTVTLLNAMADGTQNGASLTAYIDSATETVVPLPDALWLMLSAQLRLLHRPHALQSADRGRWTRAERPSAIQLSGKSVRARHQSRSVDQSDAAALHRSVLLGL